MGDAGNLSAGDWTKLHSWPHFLGLGSICEGKRRGLGGAVLTERRTHRGMTKQGWTALRNSPGKERQEGESWQNS